MRIETNSSGQDVRVTITYLYDDKEVVVDCSILRDSSITKDETFKVITLKIDDLLAKGAESGALLLGKTIFNVLQKLVEGGVGFEDGVTEAELNSLDVFMRNLASLNDPEALTHIAINYLNESIEKHDISLINLAEQYFKNAADTGHNPSLVFYRETWPNLKQVYKEKIHGRNP
jgi:hypothetical protein